MDPDYTAMVCESLGIRRALHPLDGGTHRTWLAGARNWDELLQEIASQKWVSILEIDEVTAMNHLNGELVRSWKVRGLPA